MEGIISIVMVFSIPIIAIVTSHMRKQATIKQKLIQDEIELEKLKQSNYLLETEKLRLELEKMQKIDYKDNNTLFK